MAPKVAQHQKLKHSWFECTSACKLKYLKTGQNNNDNQHDCENFEKTETIHIFAGQFNNVMVMDHPKDIDKDLDISRDILFDFVFINPITMAEMNVNIGRTVVIKQHNKEICAALCWPNVQIPLDKVAISKHYAITNQIDTEDQLSLIQKPGKIRQVSTIELNLLYNQFDCNNTDAYYLINYLKQTYMNKCILNNQLVYCTYMGQKLSFEVLALSCVENNKDLDDSFSSISLSDSYVCKIGVQTNLLLKNLKSPKQCDTNDDKSDLNLDSIGGLHSEIELLKELFIYPFQFFDLYENIGLGVSKGVILYGSSGSGKTLLARTILNLTKCHHIEIKPGEIFSRNYGESETKLKEIFSEAWNKSPCILFIDEIDTICSKRENINQDLEKRIVSLFSSLMDQSSSKNILFLATTNKLDTIDVSLRRPGRFDNEIEIQIPNQQARYEILKITLKKMRHSLSDADINEVSQTCHGYVGADLTMLVHEAGLACVRRLIKQKMHNGQADIVDIIGVKDFHAALHKIKPSAMREITFDIPKVYWSDIGGQDDLKKKLQQAIIWPLKYGESFRRLGIKAPRGLLMYGPPGCSKTMIAKALATETGLNFIAVKGPELFSKWVGESERTVREIFRKARNAAPAIIFFDEIDAVAVERSTSGSKSNNVGDRVLAQLLNEIDGVENLNDVTIVAATNRPDLIDKALMRPGRLDRIVYVRLPDEYTRREIFKLKFQKMPIDDTVNIDDLVRRTHNYSGAEITAVCNEAAYLALEEDVNCSKLTQSHFDLSLMMVVPRTSPDMVKYFDEFSSISGFHNI